MVSWRIIANVHLLHIKKELGCLKRILDFAIVKLGIVFCGCLDVWVSFPVNQDRSLW